MSGGDEEQKAAPPQVRNLGEWKTANLYGEVSLSPTGAWSVAQVSSLVKLAEDLEKDRDNEAKVSHIRLMSLGVANKERDEARAQFADLKDRVLALTTQNAELGGYLQRVAEDDVARDGHFVIEAGNGERVIKPKRPPVPSRNDPYAASGMVQEPDGYGRARKPVTWVNY